MALPPSGRRDSALAKNCFKPKMICETALPGVLDIDLEPFMMEARGDENVR
jgi:hypothetical protein